MYPNDTEAVHVPDELGTSMSHETVLDEAPEMSPVLTAAVLPEFNVHVPRLSVAVPELAVAVPVFEIVAETVAVEDALALDGVIE